MTSLKRAMVVVAASYAVAITIVSLSWAPIEKHFPVGALYLTNSVRTLFPQGWAFFTRDPQLPRYTPYALTADGWEDVSRGRNTQLEYAFGANRASRMSELDSSSLQGLIPEDASWHECGRSQQDVDCIAVAPVTAVEASRTDHALCGEVALVQRAPVPFAYGTRVDVMPGTVLRFNVSCTAAQE